jgi:glycosyltransferase involved in cell wall biosynthesis
VQRMVHAESGILVPMNSEVEMAAAIDNLSQPRVREFYSERGRARAAEFTVKASVDGYWRVIREFVSASTWPTECGPE